MESKAKHHARSVDFFNQNSKYYIRVAEYCYFAGI